MVFNSFGLIVGFLKLHTSREQGPESDLAARPASFRLLHICGDKRLTQHLSRLLMPHNVHFVCFNVGVFHRIGEM